MSPIHKRQNTRSISGEIIQCSARPRRARQSSLARPGGPFHRVALIFIILLGTYLLLLLEQVSATAAQPALLPALAMRTGTPGVRSSSATPTWTPTATATVAPATTPLPTVPISRTPGIMVTAYAPLSPTVTSSLELAPTIQVSVTWTATSTPLATAAGTDPPPVEPSITSTLGVPLPMPTLTPRANRVGALDPLPTPTAPVPAPTDVPIADNPHVAYAATTGSCAGCHRAHTSAGMLLRETWPEEDLCFTCHASEGPGTDIVSAFTLYVNSSTAFYKHDVAATSGLHSAGEADGSDFGESSRHVECEDCHEPHKATRGPAPAPSIQREMNLASGVDPIWTAAGLPAAYIWLPAAEREYQVCFKCHSGFTTLPDYAADGLPKLSGLSAGQVADSRDMAQEFNPYHASFHPVVTVGRNQSMPAASFVDGWSATSLVYCTDCHANPASGSNGPHGSPLLHLLDGESNYSTVYSQGSQVDRGEVCFECHDYDTYVTGTTGATNFSGHADHLNNRRGTTCYTCHDTHGSEQLHLINFDASVVTFSGDRDSYTAWYVDETGEAGCYLVCHGRRHDPATYTP